MGNAAASTARHRVLLVEDNQGDADLVLTRLAESTNAFLEVQHVKRLGDAVVAMTSTAVDAVVLDLNLPDSQGADTLARLRSVARDVPILVVSGCVDDVLRERVQAAGAEEVIPKSGGNSRLLPRSVLYVIERTRAREQQKQIEGLLDATPDAILVVSTSGVVRYVNRAALQLFGRGREELVGELLGFSVRDGEPLEIAVPRPGDDRVCEMRVVRFEWQGEAAFLASIRDITQQKKLETQLMMSDRLKSLGTLAAGVAHEINNPLAAVLANVSIAIEELEDLGGNRDERRALLDALCDAREAATRIRQIVRDVRVFSRTEGETRGAFEVRRILDSVARMAWNQIRHRARLVKDYGAVLPVYVNESRLSQVFLNLLVNAAQAIEEGDVQKNEIRISTRMAEDGRVVVEIHDTGSGIAPHAQRRLFTPFFTTKPAGLGTGLGLAICQRIVRSLGGEIRVESEVGRGSCFSVFLPVGRSDAWEQGEATIGATPRAKRRGKVLVVDDDLTVIETTRRVLEREHDITSVNDASHALELIRSGERFDIILCDLMMPEMTGAAFCEALAAVDAVQATKVIIMTGGAFTPQAQEFLDAAHHRLIDKPFDSRGLRALVNGFVQ